MNVMDGRREADDDAGIDGDGDVVSWIAEELAGGVRIQRIVEHALGDGGEKVCVLGEENSGFHLRP